MFDNSVKQLETLDWVLKGIGYLAKTIGGRAVIIRAISRIDPKPYLSKF